MIGTILLVSCILNIFAGIVILCLWRDRKEEQRANQRLIKQNKEFYSVLSEVWKIGLELRRANYGQPPGRVEIGNKIQELQKRIVDFNTKLSEKE